MSLCELSVHHAKAAALLHEQAFVHPWKEEEFESLLSLSTTKGWMDEDALLLVSKVLDEIEILTILTHPEVRLKGKAIHLLNHLFEFAKQEGVKKIFLEVDEKNIPAISLYEKMGFSFCGKRKNYYRYQNEMGIVFHDALLYEFLVEK